VQYNDEVSYRFTFGSLLLLMSAKEGFMLAFQVMGLAL